MGRVKSYFEKMMEDETTNLYAVLYYPQNDYDTKGVYLQCDSIWNVEEMFKNKYPNCKIVSIQCMNTYIELTSNGKLMATTQLYDSLKKYLKHYRANNISIKVTEKKFERK